MTGAVFNVTQWNKPMSTLLLADVETTGVRPTDRVVEVAWLIMDYDFNTLDRGHSLINPGIPIPSGASAIHGITNRDVAESPTLNEYFEDVLDNRWGSLHTVFTAHNASFDFRYLGGYLPEGTQQLCTLKLARKLWPDADNHKLATLVYELDLDADKDRFHSAEGDMDVLMSLLGRMAEEFGHSIEDLIHLCNQPRKIEKMPFGKHRGARLKDLPAHYVRWLLNETDNLDADLRAALQNL